MTYRGITRFSYKYTNKHGITVEYVYFKILLWDKNGKRIYVGTARTMQDALDKRKHILETEKHLLELRPQTESRRHFTKFEIFRKRGIKQWRATTKPENLPSPQ